MLPFGFLHGIQTPLLLTLVQTWPHMKTTKVMLVVLLSHDRVFKELLTPAFVHVIIQRHEFTLTTGGVSNDKENKKVESHKVISLNADPCSSAFFPPDYFFFQRKKKLKASCDLSLRSKGCLSFFFSFFKLFLVWCGNIGAGESWFSSGLQRVPGAQRPLWSEYCGLSSNFFFFVFVPKAAHQLMRRKNYEGQT